MKEKEGGRDNGKTNYTSIYWLLERFSLIMVIVFTYVLGITSEFGLYTLGKFFKETRGHLTNHPSGS